MQTITTKAKTTVTRILFLLLFLGIMGLGIRAVYKKYYSSQQKWVAVTRGEIIEAVYGLGTIMSEEEFRFRPGVVSTISNIFVSEGDLVKKGQKLIALDGQSTFITSPFEGTVTSIPYRVGENVFPQLPIVTVINPFKLYLSLNLEQTAALQIRKNQKAIISFESLRGEKFQATVDSVIPKEGQFVTHLKVENLPSGILPGMTADTAITVGNKKDALLIPIKAIQNRRIKYRLKGQKVKTESVRLGIVNEEWAELLAPELSSEAEVLIPQATQ